MTQLVAILGTGKGSWAHVSKLVRQGEFEEVVLITNNFGKEKFSLDADTSFIVVDFEQPIHVLLDTFLKELRPKLKGTEVALNMVSGSGNEHMALLSALLKLGMAIRLVVAGTANQFDEL
ncbi:hypothetical protein JXA48_04245 [Candidatus Woesearchaeota archaeon]|nr:hypothetical protein [Candidatus Woesearchaeota archaeon]